MNRHKKLAQYAEGRTLDVGYKSHPNPYLPKPMGMDIEPGEKPTWYSAVCQGNAMRIPFKAQSFDTIVAGEIIEHVDNLSEFFKDCYRVLKEKGRFVISTPNSSSFIVVLGNWLGVRVPHNHRNEYSKRIIGLIAKYNGFRKERFVGLSSPFFLVPKLRHRGFLRIPLWLLPLCHKILYVFEKVSTAEP